MSNSLIRAWELLSRPEQDTQAFREFLPTQYRYTNSTNLWKNAPKIQIPAKGIDGLNAVLHGCNIGKRSQMKTLVSMDRQGGPCLPLTREWSSNASADQYRVLLIPSRTDSLLSRADLLDDMVSAVEGLASDEKVIIRGNCWGMTEAVLFASLYPQKISGLVLGLPFLARKKDSIWLYDSSGGMAQKNPAEFERLSKIAKSDYEPTLLSNMFNQLNSSNYAVSSAAYQALMRWEYVCLTGLPIDEESALPPPRQEDIDLKKLQIRFQRDNFDMDEDGIVPVLKKIPQNIPIIVVGQSLDPLNTPDSLAVVRENLPQAEFIIQDADWHWMPKDRLGKNNYFLQQAYPYAMGRMGMIVNNQLTPEPSYQLFKRIEEIPCPN
jgi:pimeloyl-ACP methyl ester carboxylesterase